MEEFIAAALEAFTNANGNIDKFELSLRRSIMSQQSIMPATVQPLIDENFQISPDMAEELASMDLDNMSDDEIVEYATKMGLMR